MKSRPWSWPVSSSEVHSQLLMQNSSPICPQTLHSVIEVSQRLLFLESQECLVSFANSSMPLKESLVSCVCLPIIGHVIQKGMSIAR